jgi:hypothetical protein
MQCTARAESRALCEAFLILLSAHDGYREETYGTFKRFVQAIG